MRMFQSGDGSRLPLESRFEGPIRRDLRREDATAGSEYLLYDNGVFGLRYAAFPHVYVGLYQPENDTINFRFTNQDIATGTLKGDLLEVRYSAMMQQSDFEDAVYRRTE